MNMPAPLFSRACLSGIIREECGLAQEGLAFCAIEAELTPFLPTGEGGGGSWERRHEV